jgi:hypothetical protein
MSQQDDTGARAGRTGDARRHDGGPRPTVVLTGAVVRSLDQAVGDLVGVDVLVAGAVVTGVGRGLRDAAGPGARVVDCSGATLVPAAADTSPLVGTLAPGSPATFAVLPTRSTRPAPLEEVVWYADGAVLWVDGVATEGADRARGHAGPARVVDGPLVGTWYDDRVDVVQELGPDGRYDETRGGRRHAYQGCFWVDGDRVVYRDDLGFWAYGTLRGTTLHHAQFRFRRRG